MYFALLYIQALCTWIYHHCVNNLGSIPEMEEMEASFLEKLKAQEKVTAEEEEEVSLADEKSPDKANEEANQLCAKQAKGTWLYVTSFMVVLVYSSFVQ